MEARYCKDTEAVIIGGGNSAGQAAMFLSRSRAASVCWCGVPRSPLRCRAISPAALRLTRVSRSSTNSEVSALEGGEHLESVTIRNAETGGRGRLRRGRYLSWWAPRQTPSGYRVW